MKDKICYVVGAGENYGLDFQLVYLSANNMRGFLFDNGTIITAITNDRLCFEKIPCG